MVRHTHKRNRYMTTFRKSTNANQPTLARRLVVSKAWGGQKEREYRGNLNSSISWSSGVPTIYLNLLNIHVVNTVRRGA